MLPSNTFGILYFYFLSHTVARTQTRETKERFCIADVFSGEAPVTAWRSHIAEGSLNAGILTALLHQCHADMLREDAMFAVMPEHSSSHCTTQPLWLKLSDSFHSLNIIIILFSSCVSIRGTLAI